MNQELPKPICDTNPIVFLDISIGNEFGGRMIIELRKDVVPKSAENFRALCTGERGIGQLGKPLHYKGICFHKVMRVFVAHSGDVVNNNGTCGESIYGPLFEDENFLLPHDEGVVSMANYGKPNTNNSQFVITSVPCDNLNGTNVVVGRVLRGLNIISDMEQNTTDEGQPIQKIVITDCGEIRPGEDWAIADNDETDDKLPPYPQDWEDNNKPYTSDAIAEILTGIRKAGNYFFSQQRYYEARRKYRKANRYYLLLRKQYQWQELQRNVSDEDIRKLNAFAVLNNVNMAATELKLSEHENAKYLCAEALSIDANYSKAYYRRGQAHKALKNYDEAIADLKKAHELVPENKQILNELNYVRKLRSDYNRQQMAALQSFFK